MNFLFYRNVQKKDLISDDALLEMMRREIINEELKKIPQ